MTYVKVPSPANVYVAWLVSCSTPMLCAGGQLEGEIEPQADATCQVPTMLPPQAAKGQEPPSTAASPFTPPSPPPVPPVPTGFALPPHPAVATPRTMTTEWESRFSSRLFSCDRMAQILRNFCALGKAGTA